jgi:hypothetical protein
MNAKLLFKTIFLIAVALLLVVMGMNNKGRVSLDLPPLFSDLKQPAAIMYVGFFGLGLLSGAVMTAGGKKGGGKAKAD